MTVPWAALDSERCTDIEFRREASIRIIIDDEGEYKTRVCNLSPNIAPKIAPDRACFDIDVAPSLRRRNGNSCHSLDIADPIARDGNLLILIRINANQLQDAGIFDALGEARGVAVDDANEFVHSGFVQEYRAGIRPGPVGLSVRLRCFPLRTGGFCVIFWIVELSLNAASLRGGFFLCGHAATSREVLEDSTVAGAS